MPFLHFKLTTFFKNPWTVKVLFFFVAPLLTGCNSYSTIDEHPEYFEDIYRQVDSLRHIQKKSEAINLLDSAYHAFPNPGIGDLCSIDSIKYEIYFSDEVDMLKALTYADTIMNIASQRLGDDKYAKLYVLSLNYKGNCFRRLKRFDEGVRYYTLAEEAVKKYVKEKCEMNYSGSSVADMFYARQMYLQAARYFLAYSKDLISFCGINKYQHLMTVQGCLSNTAFGYLRAGLYDSAAYYQDLALSTIERNENRFTAENLNFAYAKGVIYAGQAEVLVAKGRIEEAENLYKKSIEVVAASRLDVLYVQSVQEKLIELYLRENKSDSAEIKLSDFKASLDTFPVQEHLISWYRLKIRNFAKQNKADSVFAYQTRYDTIRDLAFSKDMSIANNDISREFENLQLNYSNDTLKRESKLKNQYLIVSVIIFLMAAVIAAQIWHILRKARRLNLRIQAKNDELERAFTSLEQSLKENARIMKIVAHDLKNPISAMKNLAYSILKKEPEGPGRNAFETIHDSSMNSLALINELLYEKKDFSQATKEVVNLKKVLEQSVALLQAKANEKSQKLNLHAEYVIACINGGEMWRVISNIINNAIKFSHRNSQISIRLEKKGDKALLSVADSGIGIPVELADKIFEVSEDARRSGTAGEQSYGLGLSISRKIVEGHNGRIWFESKSGSGSVFFVELPCMN